jgi:hypothetical protein
MWQNENNSSIREADGSDASNWTNNPMNPWGNNSRSGTTSTTARSSDLPQSSPMSHSQGYSSVPMRQPSRSWDLHTHQQFHPGMPTTKWGSNSNWSSNDGCTPPTASLNSPIKTPSEIWGPPQQQSQWNPSMINGSEQKRNPGVLHRSMTGPAQTWNHKVDQQTPWDMGSSTEQQLQQQQQQQQTPVTQQEWNNSAAQQKWNAQQYAWHQQQAAAEHSPEWATNGANSNNGQQQEVGWNNGHPISENTSNESGSPRSWPVKQISENESHQTGSNGNADMLWQDPNPKIKQKKIARDTGTAIWGDPDSQKHISKIRHWKSPEASAYSQAQAENDWTTVDQQQPLQPEQGWGEPINQSKMWSIANAWSDLQDDSVPDMIIPKLAHALGTNTLFETLQSAVTANPQLANQISEQFQGAVNRNWVNQNIYTAPIVPNFAKLHQLIKRMYKKENEVLQLRHRPPSQTTNSCKERILSEIQHNKNELAEIQRAICGMPPPPVTMANAPSDGQSRLRQWKKNGNAMAGMNGRSNNHVASSLPSDSGFTPDAAMMNSLINAAHHLTINADSLNNSWKQGSLEWSPPAARDDRRKSSEESGLSSAASQLNADVQEFIPGKRWEYRDPNKICDDPNATPGSVKPNPLLSSAALRLQMNSVSKDSAASVTSSNAHNHQNGWNNSRIIPTNKQISNASPLISPNSEQPIANENYIYLPHCWLLFQLDPNITDIQFQQVCHHAGQMINFYMIGSKIACVKFNSNNVDSVIRRIRSEYPFNPEQFRIVSDEEFNNKMLKHTRYIQSNNGYDHTSHQSQHHQHPQQQQQHQQQQMMSHSQHSTPWNFVQPQMYHNDPTCQY